MSKKKFKFSVIIPIYNVEEYLEETIQSIVKQSIGFTDNVQLIFINDGSPDNSKEICLKYKKIYPDNIIYHVQPNSGVSVARNKGLELAEGEYINFLDGDDLLSINALKDIFNFFKKYNDEIDVVSYVIEYFEGRKGRGHALNYKFAGDRVVDLTQDPNNVQMSAVSCAIRKSAIEDSFDPGLKYGEDSLFINSIIIKKMKMGLMDSVCYFYRIRYDQSSAMNNTTNTPEFYNKTIDNFHFQLIKKSCNKSKEIPSYIKYVLMYDLQWRIKLKQPKDILSKEEISKYNKKIIQLLSYIDDNIIIEQKSISFLQKAALIGIKNHKTIKEVLEYHDQFLHVNDLKLKYNGLDLLYIDRVRFHDGKMYVNGRINISFVDKSDFLVYDNEKKVKVHYYEVPFNSKVLLFDGTIIHQYLGFKFSVGIESNKIINFFDSSKGVLLYPKFSKNNSFYEILLNSYKRDKDRLICYSKRDHSFLITKDSLLTRMKYDFRNYLKLFRIKKFKIAIMRFLVTILKIFKRRKIMIISDRISKADDNGEHFFKFMLKNHPEFNTYYVLSKDSPDYERLKSYGHIIDDKSKKYKFLFQISDYVLSSQGEDSVVRVLGKSSPYIQDKYDFKFIFLQHGVIINDLSPWLNVNSKRIDMFVTTSKYEYDSILKYSYGYDKDVVKLTGMPRYDTLLEKSKTISQKKQILLSFTWRANLASKINRKTGERLYNQKFKESEYYKNLNAILTNKKLISALKKYGYIIKFLPHPNVIPQIKDFKENDVILIEKGIIDYQKEFCENSLLVTDYSSIFTDFCYLRKKTIFFQPDIKTFYNGQIYNPGYYRYDDGLGPVYYDLNKLVDAIIDSMKEDCKLDKKYRDKIDDFFAFDDDHNCERVYNDIISL